MPRSAKAKAITPTEAEEQTKLAVWLTNQGIDFYAIPNGAKRSMWEAAKFKREGGQAGVPDICIPVPTKSHHGLYIELKREKGGKVSEVQAEWIAKLQAHGYAAIVCYGFANAQRVVLKYFEFANVSGLYCQP